MTPEMISLLIAVAGGAAGVVAFFYQGQLRNLREKVREREKELQEQKAEYEGKLAEQEEAYEKRLAELEAVKIAALQAQIQHLKEDAKLTEAKAAGIEQRRLDVSKQLEAKQAECGNLKNELGQSEKQVAVLEGDVLELRNLCDRLETERKARNNRVRHAVALQGQVWIKEPLSGAPKFKPITNRRYAVLSMLNLKGGVGKTTVTAYLAESFARRGYRVLLIDLDLQGSLSSLYLPYRELRRLDEGKQLLQHYLAAATQTRIAKLHKMAVEIKLPGVGEDHPGSLHIVCATDQLAYEEQALTLQWLLRVGKFDARFLIRQGLHGKTQSRQIARHFDIVLMDCPPLLTTCCVNALVASDYVIVPVTPSQKAAERVPVLLHRLRQFKDAVHPHLELMGLLSNRSARGDGLTYWEQDQWQHLQTKCQDQWGLPVKVFDTVIPRRDQEIRAREEAFGPLEEKGDLTELFEELATEVERRMPGDCCRPAQVSQQPE